MRPQFLISWFSSRNLYRFRSVICPSFRTLFFLGLRTTVQLPWCLVMLHTRRRFLPSCEMWWWWWRWWWWWWWWWCKMSRQMSLTGFSPVASFRLAGFSPGTRISVQTYFCLPWNSILSSLYTVAVRVSKIVIWTNRKRITQIPLPCDKKQACSRSLASSGYTGRYQIDTNLFTFETTLLYFQWINWQWENRIKHKQKAMAGNLVFNHMILKGKSQTFT